jgi:cell division septation protein DedD
VTRPALAIGVAMAVIAIIASFFKAPPVREAPAVVTLTREGSAAPTAPAVAADAAAPAPTGNLAETEASPAPVEASEEEASMPTREAEAITLTPAAPKVAQNAATAAAEGAEAVVASVSETETTAEDEPSPLPIRRADSGNRVQVASFKTRDFAERLVTRLGREGITSSIDQSGDFYRVLAGPYPDEAAATTAAKRIAELIKEP